MDLRIDNLVLPTITDGLLQVIDGAVLAVEAGTVGNVTAALPTILSDLGEGYVYVTGGYISVVEPSTVITTILLSGLGDGILATVSGNPAIAVAGTDYLTPTGDLTGNTIKSGAFLLDDAFDSSGRAIVQYIVFPDAASYFGWDGSTLGSGGAAGCWRPDGADIPVASQNRANWMDNSGFHGGGSALTGLTKSQVGLGSVENTTLSTWAGTTSVTTLGTITTGTWHGTAVADTYISSASTWNAKVSAGANSSITSLTGLTTALSVAQGGTGSTTASAARTALSAAASGTNGDITSLTAASASLAPAFTTLTDGSTITITCSASTTVQNASVTLGGNRTLAISGATTGMTGLLIVKQDGSGSRTLALPSGSKVISSGGGAITLSTAANAIDILAWVYDGTNYFWTFGLGYS